MAAGNNTLNKRRIEMEKQNLLERIESRKQHEGINHNLKKGDV